ncbi:MAG: tetratricopeptide repeat protein [Desulfobacterales bacterium]|jgi:cytochrome c-type biogenesis protein CcmH/NrfG|nr:tetratricopeptide repeat protein [Desulfobacterales bacterium]
MGKPEQTDTKSHVRKETALLMALLALAVGFFGGVFFGVYKSGPSVARMPGASPAPQRDFSGEIAALERQTREEPANVGAWIELGNLYFDVDQYEKSILAYRRALELQPDNADVWTDMGVMQRKAGRSAEAVASFDRATAANPKHEISRLNKGIVLLHDLQDPQGAIRAWEGLLEINPTASFPGGMSVDQMIQQLKKQVAEKK